MNPIFASIGESQLAPEDLLSLEDLTQVLDVPHGRVDSWMKEGILKPIRGGVSPVFSFEDVQEFVRKNPKSFEPEYSQRILIIDDDPLVGNSLKRILEKSGFRAATIPVGLAALDLISREPFDLIIVDIRMPGMDGLQTLKAIRELRSQFGTPCIPEMVITAYDDDQVRREVSRMGISEFILKPFEYGDLIAKLKERFSTGQIQ